MAKKVILTIDPRKAAHRTVRTALAPSGHTVIAATSAEEGVAIARRIRPALIFLSFHLQRSGAVRVLRAFSESPQLQQVPVVLTTQEEGEIPDSALRAPTVVDRVTFPIEPDALLTLTTHLLQKYGEEGVTLPVPQPEEELEEIPDEPAAVDRRKLTPRERLRRALAAAVASQSERLRRLKSSRHVARFVYDLADRVLEAEYVPPSDTEAESSDAALRGDLGVMPIPEILQMLAMQRQTGGFHIVHRSADVRIFLSTGTIDVCLARNLREEFLLGRYLVERDFISREDLDLLLASRKGSKKMLGQQLIRLGYLEESQLHLALARQSAEMVYEAVRWSDGYFFFRANEKPPPGMEELSFGLSVENLLMEGFRRVDEWHLIEREIDNFEQVFLRNEDAVARMGRGRLTREELAVLELVNGKNTVKEIVRQSRMGSFDVSKMLYRLLSIKLVRRRVQPLAV